VTTAEGGLVYHRAVYIKSHKPHGGFHSSSPEQWEVNKDYKHRKVMTEFGNLEIGLE